jgi:hypothetical protein
MYNEYLVIKIHFSFIYIDSTLKKNIEKFIIFHHFDIIGIILD